MTYLHRLADLVDHLAPDPGPLDRSADTARQFDAESEGYDLTNPPRLYYSPLRVARMLARHLPDPEAAVLDLACGTGLTGQALAELGHRHLVGADISPAMLETARGKGIYRHLAWADLHGAPPFAAESFAGIACVGTFYEGLVQARALGQVLPLLQPGGWLACDINTGAWTRGGFAALLLAALDAGLIDQLRIEAGRLFARGYLGEGGDESQLEGRFVLARRTA